ncbi:MAG: glycosyltransferase family 4 protein [Planctomycetota bacterium]
MKVLFVARSGNHPATRYRIIQYLDCLKNSDVHSELVDYPKGIWGWLKLLKKSHNFDIAFFQKKRVPSSWLKRLKIKGLKLIYDFDDAVMFNSSRHPDPESPLRMKHFIEMVKNCDSIIAGNSYLKSLAEPYHKRVWVIPTTIDTSKYPVKSYSQYSDSSIILGWIGGGKSLVFLKSLEPVLERLAKRHKNIQLKIVCNEFFDSANINIIKKQWSENDEINDILSFDIGLAPLPDDPWSRGKCATKLLQYMASGITAVASAVGVHNDIIKDGINGFLASNDDEWFDKLNKLIEDKTLREKSGTAARETVEKSYSVRTNAPKLADILKTVKNL